ncbi:MAG TPA: hypothetical protein VGL62_08980 [Vicinamibacterales bacterium]
MSTRPNAESRTRTLHSAAAWLRGLDVRLLALPATIKYAVLAVTIAAMIWQALPWVPRPIVDYSRIAPLRHLHQPATYGTDTLSDEYVARVILHDPSDMYLKAKTAQTPLEARTWSRAASGPYPPAVLLIEAGLFALGGQTAAGFYLLILSVAAVFLALSLRYFLRTRWYLFPLLYLNFGYLAYRFVGVQDDTYLIMLLVVMLALLVAERRPALADALVAAAIAIKISPMFYSLETLRRRRTAVLVFAGIVFAGLVLPYFLVRDYVYIYGFQETLKGSRSTHAAAIAAAVPFALVLWYVETRRSFDLEERIGWGVVPFALFFAIRMNAVRHLLLVLLVPDKRGWRNVAAAIGLGLHAAFPALVPLGSVLSILLAFLALILIGHLGAIGGTILRHDLRDLRRTAKMLTRRAI